MTKVEDDMRSKGNAVITFRFLVLFLLFLPLIACAGGGTSLSPGAWVPEEDRIALQDGGPHKGTWKTNDLSINYEQQAATSSLQVRGVVELGNRLTMGFSVLDNLWLNIHLLDAGGTVLEMQRIRGFGAFRSMRVLGDLNFDGQFKLTQDVVAFSFSYSGSVSDGGGGGPGIMGSSDGRTDLQFWHVPRRSPPK